MFLQRKYFPFLSINGLVFGSLAPDLDLFLQFGVMQDHYFNYGIATTFLVITPLALALMILFHLLARNIIIDHLPSSLKSRLNPFQSYSVLRDLRRRFPVITLSVVIGIYLHLLVDWMMHWDAHSVMMFFHAGIYPIPELKLIYYYSAWYIPVIAASLIGFWLIFRIFDIHVRETADLLRELSGRAVFFWLTFFVIALAVGFVKYLFQGLDDEFIPEYLSIYFTTGLLFSLFLTPVLFSTLNRTPAHD